MNTLIRRFADNRESQSTASQLRRKRIELFLALAEDLPRPVRVLDIGGTERFWRNGLSDRLGELEVVLVNLAEPETTLPNFEGVQGDARDLSQFEDGSFDVVFSNSVIEHVGDFGDQRRMAGEILRLGKRFFLQTPNRYFVIEPHFLLPYFQYYPVKLRTFLAQNFAIGYRTEKCPDYESALEYVTRITLLNYQEVRELFPAATIVRERVAGLTKSFLVYGDGVGGGASR